MLVLCLTAVVIRKMCEDSKVSARFPLRTAPESTEKFPFRNLKYYVNPEDEDEVKEKPEIPTLGYMAQKSIDFLESTGRKPNLQNVPWFREAGNNGKR